MPASRVDLTCLAGTATAFLAYWFLRVLPNATGLELGNVDLLIQFLPDHTYVAERFRAGAIPQWNPYQGQPFVATLLPGTFYPARLLLGVLDVQTAMHVSMVLHLLLGIAATYGLCRSLGAHPLGAVAGAATFTGIFALPNVYTPPFLEGGTWLPIAALALVRLASTGAWRWALAMGAAVGLTVLAGCYQHTLYTVYGLAILYLALLADRRRRGLLATATGTMQLVVAGALAIVTAAPQLLPTLAWLDETVRNGAPLTQAQLDPYPFPDRALRHMFETPTAYDAVFVSIPVAVLAALGCLVARGFGVVLLIATAVVTVLLVGSGTPAFVLFEMLPGFASFRVPDRISFLVAFLMAVDVALAVTWLASWRRVGGVAAIAAASAVCWALFSPPRASLAFPWTIAAEAFGSRAQLMDAVAARTGDGRALLPGESSHLEVGVKQSTMRHVLGLQDYNPLSSRRLNTYLNAIIGKPPPAAVQPEIFVGWVPMVPRIQRPELLDAMAVRTLLLKRHVTSVRPLRAVGTHAGGRWTLYENTGALPRAYTVSRAVRVDDGPAALAAVGTPDVDPRTTVALAGAADPTLEAVLHGEPEPLRPATIAVDRPERLALDVDVARPSVLVLTDPFAPGWTATVNGEPARVWEANGLARAVTVPAGRSHVELVYRAPGLALGLGLAAAGWTLVAAVALRPRLLAWRSSVG